MSGGRPGRPLGWSLAEKRAKNEAYSEARTALPEIIRYLVAVSLGREKATFGQRMRAIENLLDRGLMPRRQEIETEDMTGANLMAEAIERALESVRAEYGDEAIESLSVRMIGERHRAVLAPLGLPEAATQEEVLAAGKRYLTNRLGLKADLTLDQIILELHALEAARDPRVPDLRQMHCALAIIESGTRKDLPLPNPVERLLETTKTLPDAPPNALPSDRDAPPTEPGAGVAPASPAAAEPEGTPVVRGARWRPPAEDSTRW